MVVVKKISSVLLVCGPMMSWLKLVQLGTEHNLVSVTCY